MMRFLMILAALLCAGCMVLALDNPLWLPAAGCALLSLTAMALSAQSDSQRDPLTGLWNLRALQRCSKKYRRSPSVTVVYLDMDDLKHRNDTLGHAAGDESLRRTADLLRSLPADAYRVGGDEFLVIATTPFSWKAPADLPVSHGCAIGPGSDLDALIRRAEEEMYEKKRQAPFI